MAHRSVSSVVGGRRSVVVGLTGGIASGKSTVARIFAELGAEVVDADTLAREAVEPGQPAWAEIRRVFGPSALRPDGTVDRAWLGEQVFASEEARRRLNGIVHPAVIERLKARAREVRERSAAPGSPAAILVAEVQLLIEEGLTDLVDRIVLVVAKQTTQVQRLMHDKGLTEQQAWARVRSQLPVEEKRPFADWLLDGEAPLPELRRQVEAIYQSLVTGGPDADGPVSSLRN